MFLCCVNLEIRSEYDENAFVQDSGRGNSVSPLSVDTIARKFYFLYAL